MVIGNSLVVFFIVPTRWFVRTLDFKPPIPITITITVRTVQYYHVVYKKPEAKYLSVAMSLRHGDRVVVIYTRKSVYRFLRTHVDSMVRTCSPPRLAPFRKYEVAFHRGAITTMMMFDCHPITFYFLHQTDGNSTVSCLFI